MYTESTEHGPTAGVGTSIGWYQAVDAVCAMADRLLTGQANGSQIERLERAITKMKLAAHPPEGVPKGTPVSAIAKAEHDADSRTEAAQQKGKP